MEKGKPRGSTADESALTKSAAWAWLEHSFASVTDRLTPEFDVSRTKFTPKLSRYKVEATREILQNSNPTSKINASPTISPRGNKNHSLLDAYEIEMISRQLDYYIKSSQANCHGGDDGGRSAAAAEIKRKSGQNKKVSKGFWLLRTNAVACGISIDEVVDRSSIAYSRRRKVKNGGVAVVEVVGGGRRQGIRA